MAPQCVFGDFEVTLSKTAKAELERLQPAASQHPTERHEAYNSMLAYLNAHSAEAFPSSARATCYCHDHNG
eukprot:7670326-Alexandrium_andersonii.AAC.1